MDRGGKQRPKAIFVMDRDRFDDIFSADTWQEIEALVQIVAPPKTRASIAQSPALLRDVQILFSGPGIGAIDEPLLDAAPKLQAVFHAEDVAPSQVSPKLWERGIVLVAGANAEGPRMGTLVAQELARFVDGKPLEWRVEAPLSKNSRTDALPPASATVKPQRQRDAKASAVADVTPRAADAGGKPRRRRFGLSVLACSVLAHLIFLAGATYYIVARFTPQRRVTFTAASSSAAQPSKRALEHRVQLARKQQASAPPPVARRIVTSAATKIALPPLPEIQLPADSRPLPMMMGPGGGQGLRAGFGTGAGVGGQGAGGGLGGGLPLSFFGIRDTGQSVVIMIDVSDSMFTRTGDAEGGKLVKTGRDQSFQAIRDEAIQLIESLSSSARFGIVRWSGGAYSWKPQLVPATAENKQAASVHVMENVDMRTARPKGGRPGGTRHDYALEEAFALKPEVIYMLTDGNATAALPGGGLSAIEPEEIWRAAEAGQKTMPKPARLHVVYYITGADKPEERRMLKTLAARNGGKFREVEAKGKAKSRR